MKHKILLNRKKREAFIKANKHTGQIMQKNSKTEIATPIDTVFKEGILKVRHHLYEIDWYIHNEEKMSCIVKENNSSTFYEKIFNCSSLQHPLDIISTCKKEAIDILKKRFRHSRNFASIIVSEIKFANK